MNNMNIAVVGGTGPQGRGLAYRFALAGHRVTIGSRDAGRALETAREIQEKADAEVSVSGNDNLSAVDGADVVLLAVPYAGHTELVSSLAERLEGKIVLSCVNPLGFDKAGPYAIRVDAGSAAEETAQLVPTARVVGAFHHVSALSLWRTPDPLTHEDVLICGDDDEANAAVAELARSVTGAHGVVAGGLRLARELEPWTAVLISINKRYKVRSGTHISGLDSIV